MIFLGGQLVSWNFDVGENILFSMKKLRRCSRSCHFVKEGLVWDLEIFLDLDSCFFNEDVRLKLCLTSMNSN